MTCCGQRLRQLAAVHTREVSIRNFKTSPIINLRTSAFFITSAMLYAWCRQTYALVKKGLLVKMRSPVRLAVEAFAPIALSLLLWMLFSMDTNRPPVLLPAGTGAAFQLQDAAFFRTSNGVKFENNPMQRDYARTSSPLDIYYSVCCSCTDDIKTKEVISKAIGSNFEPTFVKDADKATTSCQYPTCLAFVIFSECSQSWNYTIRMPSDMVANTSLTVAAAPNSEAEPIKFGGSDGPLLGLNAYKPTRVASYLVHGFVSLQAAINRQILSKADPASAW